MIKQFIKKIIGLVSFSFALLFLGSCLAGKISPALFWPVSFLGLAFPYLMFANILILCLCLFVRSWSIIFPIIALVFSWGNIEQHIQLVPKTEVVKEGETSIRLVSYNTLSWKYNFKTKKNSKKEQEKFILEQKADIICLQETWVLSAPKNPRYHGYSLLYTDDKFGNTILTKLKVINKGVISFKNTKNEVLWADLVTKTKDTLRVYNCHLESFRIRPDDYSIIDSIDFQKEEKQIKEVRTLAGKLKKAYKQRAHQADIVKQSIDKCPYPVVVCGDFNDTPASYCYNTVKGELKDAFVEKGVGFQTTYNGKLPAFRIDYILHSAKLNCLSFDRPKVDYSDHYPIVANFSL